MRTSRRRKSTRSTVSPRTSPWRMPVPAARTIIGRTWGAAWARTASRCGRKGWRVPPDRRQPGAGSLARRCRRWPPCSAPVPSDRRTAWCPTGIQASVGPAARPRRLAALTQLARHAMLPQRSATARAAARWCESPRHRRRTGARVRPTADPTGPLQPLDRRTRRDRPVVREWPTWPSPRCCRRLRSPDGRRTTTTAPASSTGLAHRHRGSRASVATPVPGRGHRPLRRRSLAPRRVAGGKPRGAWWVTRRVRRSARSRQAADDRSPPRRGEVAPNGR